MRVEGFKLLSKIETVETIAEGCSIKIAAFLQGFFGGKNWRKKKGIATVELETGEVCLAELHWFEAHGVGRIKMKIKKLLDSK